MTLDDVIAVARDGRDRRLDDPRSPRWRAREQVDALAASPEPVYGVSTGFGALATGTSARPTACSCSARSSARTPRASAHPVEREVVRALMLLRLKTLASGRTGVRPVVARDDGRPPQRRHHAGRARVRLARLQRRPRPLSHCALVLMGEGGPSDPDGVRATRCPSCSPRRASSRSSCRRRRGSPSSTAPTACSGCCIMAIADLEQLCDVADVTAAMSVEGLLGTDAGLPRGAAHCRCARIRARPSARPTCCRCSPARRSSPRTRRTTIACRTPTRCAARPR